MARAAKELGCVALSAVVLAAAGLGCGLTVAQKSALGRFGGATGEFSSIARTEFQRSRADVIEMNRLRFELGDLDDADSESLDGLLTIDRTTARLRALDALRDYSTLLSELVSTTQRSELVAASSALVGSLGKVEGLDLDESEADAIGRAVVAVGGLIVEYRRRQAVREVVDVAHPHVIRIIELVQRDFDPADDFWNAGYRKATLDLRAAAAATVVDDGDVAGRALVREARLLALENSLRFREVGARVIETAERLRAAQQELRLAMHSDAVQAQDIDAYVAQVHELATIYELLREQSD